MGLLKQILAIDIGGTEVKQGLFSLSEGPDQKVKLNLIFERRYPTLAHEGAERVVARIAEELLPADTCPALGISTAGQVDRLSGRIRYANENMPGYTGFALREYFLDKGYKCVTVENDVNAAAYAEAHYGVGRFCDRRSFLMLTIGTGVGGAIVQNGRIYYGAYGSAGEFGALLLDASQCIEGQPYSGAFEELGSTKRLVQLVQERFPGYENGRKVFWGAETNPEIRKIVSEWLDTIAQGLACLVHIFNPTDIVLGGGVMENAWVRDVIQQAVNRKVMPSFQPVRIRLATLGNYAGLYGAAHRVLKAYQNGESVLAYQR